MRRSPVLLVPLLVSSALMLVMGQSGANASLVPPSSPESTSLTRSSYSAPVGYGRPISFFSPPSLSNYYARRWLDEPLQSDGELGMFYYYPSKRSGALDVDEKEASQREPRSPLGTMRFGKRGNSLPALPLGTMRFGRRKKKAGGQVPLGTMRFGKK